tara:strand:- start:19532 stop:19810 length:279 start_codon:yes stop_codon:yes gene_type:complete
MGGIARAISKVFSGGPKTAPTPVTAEPTVTSAKKTTDAVISGKGKSSYGSGTIMGSASGDESEANVGKTVLGGGSVKKKKKTVVAPTEAPVA